MPFPVLLDYLARLSGAAAPGASIWRDDAGKARGRFFNCTMTSAFQPIRQLDTHTVHAYEGLARSVSAGDTGLSLWKLLDHAASDDQSVELDRLCRMLHAINFFRQPEGEHAQLYLNVHDRLLSAVSSNHGYAFQRILDALGLPLAGIVLQLPAVTDKQSWLLNYVADNYQRNGFACAVNVNGPGEALGLLERLQPATFKLDARSVPSAQDGAALLTACRAAGVKVIFKRVDNTRHLDLLRQAAQDSGLPVLLQGYLLDQPGPSLAVPRARPVPLDPAGPAEAGLRD
ncbi:MAG: EAL domain-containing protein [Pseudomonadota bacterium]